MDQMGRGPAAGEAQAPALLHHHPLLLQGVSRWTHHPCRHMPNANMIQPVVCWCVCPMLHTLPLFEMSSQWDIAATTSSPWLIPVTSPGHYPEAGLPGSCAEACGWARGNACILLLPEQHVHDRDSFAKKGRESASRRCSSSLQLSACFASVPARS